MIAGREMSSTLREGNIALLFGITFLFLCIGLRTILSFLSSSTLGSIFLEGLSICGWVAMWRPIQIFLYDWWAMFRKKKIYEKIRDMPIDINLD
jgi:hypothetical protein